MTSPRVVTLSDHATLGQRVGIPIVMKTQTLPTPRSTGGTRRTVIVLLLVAVVMLMLGVVTFRMLLAPAAPLWDYDHTVRQSPGLDPENRIDVRAPFIVADSGWVYTEAQGFTARIYGTTEYLCVLVPMQRPEASHAELLGDKVAYIGLAAPIVGSTQNAWIPSAGNVDVRFMLTREQFEEFKRDGISPERLQRLRYEAERDGWRPLRMGRPANTTVRTIPW